MKHKINFYYSSDTSNGDKVNILESTKEMLKNFGEPGTWENLTELINNIKKKSNTNSEEYEEFKPKVLFGEGLNLDSTLDTMKNSIVETLNAIYDYLEKADEINTPDQISGGNNGGYSGGGAATTTTGNTGNEKIPDGSPSPETVIPIVTGDNPEPTDEINVEQGITKPPEVETTTPTNEGQEIATLHVEENGTIDVFDGNGKKVDTYGKGQYKIYEYKYDENGKEIAARISPDGEEEKWIHLNETNENAYIIKDGQKGTYNLGENNFPIYDENGQQVGNANSGNYTVYETKYDKNGNPIAVRISPDGEPEKWLKLDPSSTNGYYAENGQKGNYFLREGSLSIYDENGNIVGTATAGNFNVYGTKVDEKGNIIAIKISKPGEAEQWVYINATGTNGFYINLGQKGTYEITGQSLKIYDNKGNVIGMLQDGKYNVYEVRYDAAGKVMSVRISPNGQEEQWIYTTDENGKIIGEFKSIENMMKMDDGKVILTTPKKKNNSLKYLGILGGLSVALGTTLIIKKKINEKNNEMNEYEDTDEEYTEEPLEPGDYNVYEIKKDENNNITDARISEDNAKDELWVHF